MSLTFLAWSLIAAQIMLAVAQERYPSLAETADVGLVPSQDEAAFDVTMLQPVRDAATAIAHDPPVPSRRARPR